jgi:hypothetical protein
MTSICFKTPRHLNYLTIQRINQSTIQRISQLTKSPAFPAVWTKCEILIHGFAAIPARVCSRLRFLGKLLTKSMNRFFAPFTDDKGLASFYSEDRYKK